MPTAAPDSARGTDACSTWMEPTPWVMSVVWPWMWMRSPTCSGACSVRVMTLMWEKKSSTTPTRDSPGWGCRQGRSGAAWAAFFAFEAGFFFAAGFALTAALDAGFFFAAFLTAFFFAGFFFFGAAFFAFF